MDKLPAPGLNSLEKLIFWVRNANAELQKATLSDYTSVLRISLRQAVGSDFLEKLPSGVRFSLSWSLLPTSKLVRLRGVSASFHASGDAALASLAISVKPPQSATFRYIDDVPRERDIKEQPVSDSLFGRVRSINSPQPADVLGVQGWFNASPFGEWLVGLPPTQGQTNLVPSGISDIFIDLLLVSQPAA